MADKDPFKELKNISKGVELKKESNRPLGNSGSQPINPVVNNYNYYQNFYPNQNQRRAISPTPIMPVEFKIKPNIKKAFLKNIFNLLTYVILVIVFLLVLNYIVGLDVFLAPLETLGINIKIDTLLTYMTIMIFCVFW
jgi:hypothetical protein